MQDIYEILEFNKIRETLASFTHSERGKELALNLKIIADQEKLEQEFKLLNELDQAYRIHGLIPISFSFSLLDIIKHAKKGGILSISDLDKVKEDVKTSLSVKKYLNNLEDNFLNLKDINLDLFDLAPLEKAISKVITPSLGIYDNATPELNVIRKHIAGHEKKLQKTVLELASHYKDSLNETSMTIRDGHYVLPVKTVEKFKVKGIVHDISDTGATTFIEPEAIVNLNNELVALKYQESEEIKKILKALTNLVILDEEKISINNEIIAHLDLLNAKVSYAKELDALILSSGDHLYYRLARHPLIAKDKVVANSFKIDLDKRGIIISGPNAGGKTVVLKTVGLISLMHKCALFVPVSEGIIPNIKNIYVDIGDNQSLSDNLSTFSAHIQNIASILDVVKEGDLVLLDELGTGTDPTEGEALAISITKKLLEKKCLFMISSHFSSLKDEALSNPLLDNASMLFDEENLTPTYIFKQGLPGESYALEVASRYGISSEIIVDSKKYIASKRELDNEEMIKALRKQTLEIEKLKDELLLEKENLQRAKEQIAKRELEFEKKKDKLVALADKEKEKILEEAKKEVDEVLKALANPDLKLHEAIKLKTKLKDITLKEEEEVFDEEIHVDDYVKVPSLDIDGRVIRINAKKAFVQTADGLSFNVEVHKLKKIPSRNIKKKNKVTHLDDVFKRPSVLPELNIIGLHVEEAKYELEKYLDSAKLANYQTVRVIHGFGSGKLRAMTQEYCKKLKLEYRLGNEYEGGGGATIITLKKSK